MNATTNPAADNLGDPGEIEALLPWHAAGTLKLRDARRVEDALSRDAALSRQYDVIRDEYAATISLNESLGAPSLRAMQKLFDAIDAEPARMPSRLSPLSRVFGFFAGLQPRTLAYASAAAAVLVLLQAGVIGTLMRGQGGVGYQTAAIERATSKGAPVMLIRFAADARADEITKFLDGNGAAIVGGPRAGLFQVRVGENSLSKDEAADVLKRVQADRIVGFAAAE